MNRSEFFESLKTKLQGLPEADIAKALEYYEEAVDDRIEDGLTEEQAINAVGTPDEIAEKILMETPLSKVVAAKAKPKRKLKGWELALIIATSPIWSILLFCIAIVVFVLLICILVMIICIVAIVVGLLGGGIVGIAANISSFIDSGVVDMVQTGSAIAFLGLGLLLVVPIKNLVVLIFEKLGKGFRSLKRKIVNK